MHARAPHRKWHLDGQGALCQGSGGGLIDSKVGEDAPILIVLPVGLLCEDLGHHQLAQQSQGVIFAAQHMLRIYMVLRMPSKQGLKRIRKYRMRS